MDDEIETDEQKADREGWEGYLLTVDDDDDYLIEREDMEDMPEFGEEDEMSEWREYDDDR